MNDQSAQSGEAISPKSFSPRRRRGLRAVIFSALLLVVTATYSLYANGYGVLIGSHEKAAVEGNFAVRECAYFTGRETVINHITRASHDVRGKPSCPWVAKVFLAPRPTVTP